MLRELGNSGIQVYPVGLGAMSLSIADRPPEVVARQVIVTAIEAGVSLIDTADSYCLDDTDYGHNERLIAAALADHGLGSQALLATKGGVERPGGEWRNNARPDHLRAACESSLRNLGAESIGLYYLHAPDPEVPFEESFGELVRLRDEGKIRHLGLSNVTEDQVNTAMAMAPVDAVENRCNIFEREDLENGFVDHCVRRGISYVAYAPCGGHNGHKRTEQVDALGSVARDRGTTPQSVALAWLLAQRPNIIAIPGATRPESIRASVAAARLELNEAEMDALSAVSDGR